MVCSAPCIACNSQVKHTHTRNRQPPNILLDIDEQGVLYAVITDFGVTQVVNHTTLVVKAFHVSKMAGASPCYAAPELLDRRLVPISTPSITQAADTFSFGVILVELIMRMAPWKSAKSVDDAVRGVIAGDRGYRRPLHFGGRDFHQRLVSLVERCWAQAPRVRPLMHAVHAELVEVLDKISPS